MQSKIVYMSILLSVCRRGSVVETHDVYDLLAICYYLTIYYCQGHRYS